MAGENEVEGTGPASNDNAALEAVAGFWQEGGRDEAASEEVPDAAPANSEQSSRMQALRQNDLAEQQQELEQEGQLDPTSPDGIPVKEVVKPVQPAKTATKPAGQAETEDSGLDPVLRSIAEDSGWTPEKIDRLYKADPELAVETFESLANSYANLSRQFLAPSPAQASPQRAAVVQGQTAQSPTGTTSQLPAELTDESLKKFAEENGDPAANLVKSLRDHFIAKSTALEQTVEKFNRQFVEAETRAVAQEAGATISQLSDKFPKVYGQGDNPQTLTLSQWQKRTELASMADQIRAGATAQGRTLSVKEALQRAHYIVSRDSVKAETRKEIQGQVKKRSASATAKPTQRNNPASGTQKRGDEAAVLAASEKMAEIGMND